MAALKFADLQNFRGTNYVFDLDRFTSFEGKTGPYLLYQAVRIKSILRRPEAVGASTLAPIVTAEPAERELSLPARRLRRRPDRKPTIAERHTSSPSTPIGWRKGSRNSTPPARC